MLKKYLNFIIEKVQPKKIAETEITAGKNVFNSFLRAITSLGLKDIEPSWDNIPDDFLLYFEFKTDYDNALQRLNRYPSLSMFSDKLPKEDTKLYFGIKNNMVFSFGFLGDSMIQIGSFAVNNSTVRYLNLLDSASASHLKKELAFINLDKLILIAAISKYIKIFHPGNTNKRTFKIENGNLVFGYHGLGNWNNGAVENITELQDIFKQYLDKFNYRENIIGSIKADKDSWIYVRIKIK